MTARALTDRYGTEVSTLPGGADAEDIRIAALRRVDELGLPHRRLPTWHYTDLTSLAALDLEYVGASPDQQLLDKARTQLKTLALDVNAPCFVFIDGHLTDALSTVLEMRGLAVATLADQTTQLLSPPSQDETALQSLNTAFVRSALLFQVSAQLNAPLQLVWFNSGTAQASQQKLRIELAADARAEVAQYFIDIDPAGDGWLNQVLEIDQAPGSEMSLFRLQSLATNAMQTTLTRATLASNARLTACSMELGGALVRNEILVGMNGAKAHADLSGLTLTRSDQHSDTRIAIEHAAPHTTSHQTFRSLADDNSRCVFNGKVTIHKDAQHIDARQKSDNLLLSESAEIDTKPELEIYADQVACSHGATVGELSDDHLFYLRSRGIDAILARRILTTAFAEVILTQIANMQFQAQARNAVHKCLPGHLDEATLNS